MRAENLTAVDAGFLQAEDSDGHVSLAIGGLALLEGPQPDYTALVAVLADRMSTVPRCSQVLRTHALDLGAPEWVDDPAFDIRHHVRRAAVPSPGDEAALFQVVADVMARRLNRDRPLWECWIIDGLADKRWAILMKIHHCIADGVAATQLLAVISDGGQFEEIPPTSAATAAPVSSGHGSMLAALNPLTWMAGGWNLSVSTARAVVRSAAGAAEIVSGLISPSSSSLTGPLSDLRHYRATRVSLHDVEEVSRRFGVTINDVALAAITDSYRAAIIRGGGSPKSNSLRTLVPVSVRTADRMHIPDNRVSVLLPMLPVDTADPVARLRIVHRRLMQAKSSGQREAANSAVTLARFVPFPLTAWTVRLLTRLPQRGVVTVATNVPGPRRRLQVMGRKVLTLMPIPPIALQLRSGIAIMSYADDLVFGVLGDFDSDPGVDELAAGIGRGIERLVSHRDAASPD